MKIGFIGLGIMGAPMALNLLRGGHDMYLASRSGVPDAMKQPGVTPCSTAQEVASQAEIVILMVPDTADVEAVLFGANGVAAGLKPGSVVVDMSSISPIETKAFAARIAEAGCDYVDAPVSGGEVGAKAATLTIMAGGTQAAFDRVQPLFALMGKNITLVGDAGAGQVTKVANQIIVALTIEAVSEALLFASKAGADPGARAPGAAGRLRQLPHPGGACRADDQAHLRSRLPYRAAPKGPQPGATGCPHPRRVAAQYGVRAGPVQQLRRPWRRRLGPFGDDPRAGDDGEPRDRLGQPGEHRVRYKLSHGSGRRTGVDHGIQARPLGSLRQE